MQWVIAHAELYSCKGRFCEYFGLYDPGNGTKSKNEE